jgi:hypothetical protein
MPSIKQFSMVTYLHDQRLFGYGIRDFSTLGNAELNGTKSVHLASGFDNYP